MQSSRDSSVWRSLAVAFGGGLAFGVGMKLTQGVIRQGSATPAVDLSPISGRIEAIEGRLNHLAEAPGAAPGAAIDRQLLEPITQALDARLNEQAEGIERRLTELERSTIRELQTLQRQDQSIVSLAEAKIGEAQTRFSEQMIAAGKRTEQDLAALRADVVSLNQEFAQAVARIVEQQVASHVDARMVAFEKVVQDRAAGAAGSQFRVLENQLREEIRQAVGRAASLVASAAENAIDEKLLPLREELARKDREIADLRARLGDNDRNVLDLILALGQICRDAAGRITYPPVDPAALDRRVEAISAPPPIAADEGLAETEPSAEAEPEAKAAEDSSGPEHPGPEPVATIEVDPIPCASELADDTLPGFARMGRTSRMWRIPLVSSFLVAGSLVVLRLW